jgi:tRNA pseudouridine55 synthase
MDGMIAVDKPAGWTSHDAVAYVKRAIGVKKAGHTGTLDPGATGLLVVLVGRATRLARYFEHDRKTYRTVLALGEETDTQDAEGKVTERCDVPLVDEVVVTSALERFRGEISQLPPMYSAVKVGGRPLYKHARAGVEVERTPRTVTVHDIRLEALDGCRVTFDVECSKGTYIRTLCRDIARELGSCGHMEALRRTGAGGLTLDGAIGLAERPGRQELESGMTGLGGLLAHMPAVMLGRESAAGVLNGRRPTQEDLAEVYGSLVPGTKLRLMDPDGRLIAIAGVGPKDGDGCYALGLEVVLP